MKKTIIALIATTGVACASLNYEDAAFKANSELMNGVIASYNFNEDGGNLVGDYSLHVWGGLDIGEIPGDFSITEYGYADISSNGVYSTNMGTEFNTGSFTISFDLISSSYGVDWCSLLSLYSGDEDGLNGQERWQHALSFRNEGGRDANYYLSLADGGEEGYDGRTDNSKKIDSGVSVNNTTPTTITIVSAAAAEGEQNGTLTLFVDGKEKGKVTDWNAKNLVGINFGGTLGGNDKVGASYIDNVTIWNTALSADAVASLMVPEPTTATLSLLALAGLAARRRRK